MFFCTCPPSCTPLMTPPFSDHVPPTIQSISVSPYHGGDTRDLACLPPAGSVSLGPVNHSLYILFPASDNVAPPPAQMQAPPHGPPPFLWIPTLPAGPKSKCPG